MRVRVDADKPRIHTSTSLLGEQAEITAESLWTHGRRGMVADEPRQCENRINMFVDCANIRVGKMIRDL